MISPWPDEQQTPVKPFKVYSILIMKYTGGEGKLWPELSK